MMDVKSRKNTYSVLIQFHIALVDNNGYQLVNALYITTTVKQSTTRDTSVLLDVLLACDLRFKNSG